MMAARIWIGFLGSVCIFSRGSAQAYPPWSVGLGPWGEWSSPMCPVTCGIRPTLRTRSRDCINPQVCSGQQSEVETQTCDAGPCPVLVEKCSYSNRDPAVDGNWGAWSVLMEPPCPVTCGEGVTVRIKRRRCDSPAPSNGGAFCARPETSMQRERVRCSEEPCINSAVDGNWGAWSVLVEPPCPVTCGEGVTVRIKRRRCDSPAPSNGGAFCARPETSMQRERVRCNEGPCSESAVDGNWGAWSVLMEPPCPVSCGEGVTVRIKRRRCDSPAPSNGGAFCARPETSMQRERVRCSEEPCINSAVDGNWGAWSVLMEPPCPVTCGEGVTVRIKRRRCDSPAPSNGGAFCARPETSMQRERVRCNEGPCSESAVDGNWGAWSVLMEPPCPVTCGEGVTVRIKRRRCDSPAPSNGGAFCARPETSMQRERVRCNEGPCSDSPVDGNWGAWTVMVEPPCSVTCGGGLTLRVNERKCDNPAPSNGGAVCADSSVKMENIRCNEDTCASSVDGGFGQWTTWTSPCSVTCGSGTLLERKTRQCDNPPPQHDGKFCIGELVQNVTKECDVGQCPGVAEYTYVIVAVTSGSLVLLILIVCIVCVCINKRGSGVKKEGLPQTVYTLQAKPPAVCNNIYSDMKLADPTSVHLQETFPGSKLADPAGFRM